MDLEKYAIDDEKEIITFRRWYIEESGKMDCRYCLWNGKDGSLLFGITNPHQTQAIGISVKKNCDNIIKHLQRMIDTRQVKVAYRYIPAPPESTGTWVICEVLPSTVHDIRPLDNGVIEVLRQILKYIIDQFRNLEH